MTRVYLGLGSNIDAEHNLKLGVIELRRRYGELEVSAVYESRAVGFEGADFLNLVVGCDTDESPLSIQEHAESIHDLVGRDRRSGRYSSRPLDIDLLTYGNQVIDEEGLKLPRCDVLEYSFVLRPLAELDPGLQHPVTGRSMADHWQAFDAASHPLRPVDVIL
jgi:2-amino-4-hydroxy-6-hydroxymethyldihydropteridine diphosphokinase